MLTGSTARLYLSNEKEASHGMLLSFSTSFTCYQLMVNKDEYISIVCGLNGFWMCLLAAMLAGRRYCPDTGGGTRRRRSQRTQCACLDRHRPSTEDDLITGSAYYQAVCGHHRMKPGRTKHRPLKARGVRT